MGCDGMKSRGLLEQKMTTVMTRLELFVPEQAWRSCQDMELKTNLLGLVHRVEFELQENLLREWNIERFSQKSASVSRSQLFKIDFPQDYGYNKRPFQIKKWSSVHNLKNKSKLNWPSARSSPVRFNLTPQMQRVAYPDGFKR